MFNIPPHGAFGDRLAQGLIRGFPFESRERSGEVGDNLALARTTILLPNRRAVRSVRDAFVRASGGALLLPRLTALGDLDDELMPELAESAEDLTDNPVVPPLERTIRLMPLIERWQQQTGRSRAKVETWRYAEALGRVLDLMQLYDADPRGLAGAVDTDLARHWQHTTAFLDIVAQHWPQALAQAGLADHAQQRQAFLQRMTQRWRAQAPDHPVVAAGIAAAEPVTAKLLGVIARLPRGAVVLPGLDLDMTAEDWSALQPHHPHPQVPLKLLLDGMSVARAEVDDWSESSVSDGPAARSPLLAHAFAPPERTADWVSAEIGEEMAAGLHHVEAANPAGEAMAAALALRRALETPGKSAALVTPDRELARRVAAQMRRWGVEIDDSAGTPLSLTPPGAFMRLALEAAASGFAPVPLMALLKHPLAGPGPQEDGNDDARADWLRRVRRLDLILRGVRPARGLQGTTNRLYAGTAKAADRDELIVWWKEIAEKLRPVAALFQRRKTGDLAAVAAVLRELISGLSDARFWNGPAGRAAADILGDLERYGSDGGPARAADLPALFGAVLGGIAVRPSYALHPRLAIYGLLEARLQRADLMILGGLNEGVWPPADTFDPWLPPKVREVLGLPPPGRALSLSAHDFVQGCGAAEVLLTRAERDASAPTVTSRFWLRLQALLGERFTEDEELAALSAQMDRSAEHRPAARPHPAPPAKDRPRKIRVTEVETLRADPYQFWAKHMLGLQKLDSLGEDAGPRERGTIVHELLEELCEEGGLHDEVQRAEKIAEKLKRYSDHPLLGALWQPRVDRMLRWAAEQMGEVEAEGWRIAGVERGGTLSAAGVTLSGKADVIFERGGSYGIADYKTGAPPPAKRIDAGYADQLALLAWMAEAGAFEGVPGGGVSEIAYWRLSGGETEGRITRSGTVRGDHPWSDLQPYLEEARERFRRTAARWLTGEAPFTPRLRPEFAPYNDYAQLARVAEWEGSARGE